MYLRPTILLINLIFWTGFSFAQPLDGPEKLFSPEQLQEDFHYWKDRLESKHPLLYVYTPKVTIDSCFESIRLQLDKPMDGIAFFKLLAPLTSVIKDGHNAIIPSTQTIETIANHQYLLPLYVRFINEKLYVVKDLSEQNCLPTGAEILRINGIPSEIILDKFLSVIPTEGNNPQLALTTINEYFRFQYHIYYGFAETYTIEYLDENGEQKQCPVKGSSLTSIRATNKSRFGVQKKRDKSAVSLSIIDSLETAILQIKTFNARAIRKGARQRFKKEISNYFDTILESGIQHLVIDLRDNHGGNPNYVKFVLKHLFDEPFEQALEARVVTASKQERFFKRTKKKWYPWCGIGTVKPAKENYKGKIYVLINGGTFSAAVEMAGILKKYDRATFIGTETGGNPVLMSGYLIKTVWNLPNTKIQVLPGVLCTVFDDLSLNTGRGLLPDHQINRTAKDYFDKTNKELNFTLDLIRNVQK